MYLAKSPNVTLSLGSGRRNGSRVLCWRYLSSTLTQLQSLSPSFVYFPLPMCSGGNSCLSLGVIIAHYQICILEQLPSFFPLFQTLDQSPVPAGHCLGLKWSFFVKKKKKQQTFFSSSFFASTHFLTSETLDHEVSPRVHTSL